VLGFVEEVGELLTAAEGLLDGIVFLFFVHDGLLELFYEGLLGLHGGLLLEVEDGAGVFSGGGVGDHGGEGDAIFVGRANDCFIGHLGWLGFLFGFGLFLGTFSYHKLLLQNI
jgi:hypothetical protein